MSREKDVRIAFLLVRIAALLVPRARREEWRREWMAELDAWEAAGRPLMGSALGAFPHALWLTCEDWTMRMGRLGTDLRVVTRTLFRRPLFTLAVTATLMIGVGPTIAVFSVVEAVLLRPLPYPESHRILALGEVDDAGSLGNTGFTTAWDWRERMASFSELSVIRTSSGTLTGAGDPEPLAGMRVSWNYFDLIRVQPALGRDFLPEEDRAGAARVVLLSHGLWERRFGSDRSIVGKAITLGGNDFTVVGVMPRGYEDVPSATYYAPAEYWLPIQYQVGAGDACRTCRHLRVLARLAPGVSLESARTELAGVMDALIADHPADYPRARAAAEPLHDVVVGPVRTPLRVLLGAVGFVLLIACANVASLMLSRASEQMHEVALRSALGASRSDLMAHAGVQCVLLATAGCTAGAALGAGGARLLVALAPSGVLDPDQLRLHGPVVAFALGVTLLTTLVVGVAPVLYGSRAHPAAALKDEGRTSAGRGRHRARAFLVVADVAVALLLLSGVGLTLRSLVGVLRVDPGFDPSNVARVVVSPSGPQYGDDAAVLAFHRQVLDNVRALPSVASAGLASQVPLGGDYDRIGLDIEGRVIPDAARHPEAERYLVAGDYLETMRSPFLEGRVLLESDDENAPYVVLVNETFARRWFPAGDAVGSRIRPGRQDNPWRTIVGVVGDVRHYALEQPAEPQIYVPQPQWPSGFMTLVVRTRGESTELLAGLREAVWSVDRDIPVSGMTTFDALIATATAQRRFVLGLLGVFAAAALLLTGVGIYGLLSNDVVQRKREIGIRVALGAGYGEVFRFVVVRGLSLSLVGVGAGLIAALGLTRFLEGLLYGVEPTDPLTLAAVACLMLGVALMASWPPARRAMRLDASTTLASESSRSR